MFTSHKSDAQPRSRHSSMDSSPSGLPFPASASESWSSQGSNDTPHTYNAMQTSPEQRHGTHSIKRSSVFNFRSRSNTGASTTSVMSENDTSRPGTALTHHQHEQPADHERSGSRKSLFRGKKGKRLSDSVPANVLVTDHQERDGGERRMSMLRRSKKSPDPSEQSSHGFKYRISSPFGFQHLTHTNRQHFASYQQTSGDKLAAGFRTMPSPLLGGTETVHSELHFSNFSSDNLAAQNSRSPSSLSFGSPPQSPRVHHDIQQPNTTPQGPPRPNLRLSRSVDSFSQPGLNNRIHRHSQSVLAPPRLSSLSPLPAIDDIPEESLPVSRRSGSARPRSKRESGVWDTFSHAITPDEAHLPGPIDEPSYFSHAFTTPDDIALPAMTPSFSPSLDDVAEEPERFVKPRRAPQPPMKGPTTPGVPHFDTSIFNSQRSPETRRRARGDSRASPRSYNQGITTSRPVSQQSETLGSSDLVRRVSNRKPHTKRRDSNTWRATDESWEDSIDYIYDHALEADCDFEWDRASDDASEFDDYRASVQRNQPPYESSSQYQTRDFRVSLLVPNAPDLVPTSATSVSTMGTGLTTPCSPFHGHSVNDAGEYMISPSLLVPPEYKEDQEDMYEDLLNSYEDSERHFPMLDPRYSGTSSARSRRSSYDSSLMSSALSLGMWSSPVRRSASSAGSVPDLVPSRRSRRDLGFSLVIDHMADSVSSLSHLDEEKEDESVTPPGHPLANRTFFPAEDEPEETIICKTDLEGELRASLELARCGSQRSTQVPRHHKQTRSDGAAKLLSAASVVPATQAPKQRSRAATTSHATKSPMLSLFPSPPRHPPRM